MAKRPRISTPNEAAKKQKTESKLPKDVLYARCVAAKPMGEEFSDHELLALGVTDDPQELSAICNELMAYHLISITSQTQRGVTYRTRSKTTAVELASSKQEVVMIYDCIESYNTSGIWKRNIVARTGLHDNVVNKGLKKLIQSGLVKEINPAKPIAKRIYILSFLEPDDEHTGGRFFTEGELDLGLVDGLSKYVLVEIRKRSWVEQPAAVTSNNDMKGKKRKAGEMEDADTNRVHYRAPKGPHGRPLVAHPPGYSGYPTVVEVAKMIEQAQILKDVTLTKADVSQLLTKLELDGRLERIKMKNNAVGYRAVRQFYERELGGQDWYGPLNPDPYGSGPGNGFTQTPCGRCPVFDNCTPGGLVSPDLCIYMADWLSW